MRTIVIASVMAVAAVGTPPATAQRLGNGQIAIDSGAAVVVQTVPGIRPAPLPPGMAPQGMPVGNAPAMPRGGGPRWGVAIGGHWWGGVRAPGGWRAYQRPVRGFLLPSYWFAPSFFITDFAIYGLDTPPYGYRWVRYYDDAVLVDGDGRVWDSVRGVDWDRGQGYGYDSPAYADQGYANQGHDDRRYDDHRYDDRSGQPGAGYAPPPPPPPSAAPVIQPIEGGQGYTRRYVAGGGYADGYWYPPTVTTTVTVQTAPIVTTTTTEYIETTYRPVRRVYHAPKRRVVHRCDCGCGCR
jgi:hypothetical protein